MFKFFLREALMALTSVFLEIQKFASVIQQWALSNEYGQWAVSNEQSAMSSERWVVSSGQWAVNSEQWTVSEQWAVSNQQWAVSDEQWADPFDDPNSHLSTPLAASWRTAFGSGGSCLAASLLFLRAGWMCEHSWFGCAGTTKRPTSSRDEDGFRGESELARIPGSSTKDMWSAPILWGKTEEVGHREDWRGGGGTGQEHHRNSTPVPFRFLRFYSHQLSFFIISFRWLSVRNQMSRDLVPYFYSSVLRFQFLTSYRDYR